MVQVAAKKVVASLHTRKLVKEESARRIKAVVKTHARNAMGKIAVKKVNITNNRRPLERGAFFLMYFKLAVL